MAEAPSVGLRNRRARMVTLNLPRHVVPERAERAAVGVRDHAAGPSSGLRDASERGLGGRSLRVEARHLSGSLTLSARGTAGSELLGLPPSVLRAPDVVRALRGPDPDVEVIPTEPPPPPPPQES